MGYERALSLLKKGRSNPSDYQVVLPFKALGGSANQNEVEEYCSFFCRAVSLPGFATTMTGLTGHENIGIKRNVVTGKTFGSPIVATFSDRSDLIIYNTLKGWMDQQLINSEQTAGRSLRVQYYDTAKSDLVIYKLEPIQSGLSGFNRDEYAGTGSAGIFGNGFRQHKPTGKWTFINCIPAAIEQTTMSLEAADSLLDFTIAIAYESFNFEDLSEDLSGLSTLNNRI